MDFKLNFGKMGVMGPGFETHPAVPAFADPCLNLAIRLALLDLVLRG